MIPDLYFEKPRKIGLSLLAISLAVWFMAGEFPYLTEYVYSRGFYPLLASGLAAIGSVLPFAFNGLVIIVFILVYVSIPFRQFRRNKALGFIGLTTHIVLSFISTTGFLLFLLMTTFLFNHHRYSEEELYNLSFEITDDIYIVIFRKVVLMRANYLSENV